MRPFIKNIVVTGLGAWLITACGIMHKYESPLKNQQSSKLYRGQTSSDTASMAALPWQQLFADEALRGLIQKGLEQNYDLKIAVTRMNSASANLQQSKLALLPTVSATAQMTHSKPSTANARANGVNVTSIPSNDIYALFGSASWELDVWGKLRSSKRAYVAAYLQSDAYKRAVQTQLVAQIATNYYQLLAYDEQLRIVEETIKIREKAIETAKVLKANGVLNKADLANSEANLYAAQLQIPVIKQSRRELENALSTLLAMPSDSIVRGNFAAQQIGVELKTGVSAQLLANRPDVQQAEHGFRNAFELTNMARTYFYPSLTISATAGWNMANTVQDFFKNTFYGNIIGGLTQPIFNQGLNKQRLRKAQATQQEMLFTFEKTVLTAGQEVSNALYSYQMAIEKEKTRKTQIESLQKAADFTKELLKYSSNTNYTDVLTAEQNLLTAQLNGVSDKLQQLQASVELYRALGGGWR